MNERRRFLQVIGGGALAIGTGCSASSKGGGPTGGGGSGSGGSGSGGETGSGGTTTTTTTTTGPACEANPVGTKLGKPTDYATDGLHIVTNEGVLIGRDTGGLYALTSICTHQGCDMATSDSFGPLGQISGMDIVCNCHGSKFGPTGSVVNGPAHTPLRAFALALGCDGYLYCNKSQVVASTVRLMA